MKKLMYFIGVCILCAVMATACTSNETKNKQEVSNLVEETNTNKEAIEVDGEYLIIDKEAFTDIFNTRIESSEALKGIGKIEKWDKTNVEGSEIYETSIANFTMQFEKPKKDEKYLWIELVDSTDNSEEDYNNMFAIMYMLATICEDFDDLESEKFKNDMLEVFNDIVNTKSCFENGDKLADGYILGEKCVYEISYTSFESIDDTTFNNTIYFSILPATAENISASMSLEEMSKEIPFCSTKIDEESEKETTQAETTNKSQQNDTTEQKIITATKKVFGEENYINVFYEPEDNFVLIKAKGKDLLSSSMSAKGMLKSIKDTLYEIREIPDLNVDFNIVYTMVNSAGDTSDDIVIKATYKNETRNSINWDEYVLHEDMPKIADEWWAHTAIQKALEE